jgi:hypothetical protein
LCKTIRKWSLGRPVDEKTKETLKTKQNKKIKIKTDSPRNLPWGAWEASQTLRFKGPCVKQ